MSQWHWSSAADESTAQVDSEGRRRRSCLPRSRGDGNSHSRRTYAHERIRQPLNLRPRLGGQTLNVLALEVRTSARRRPQHRGLNL